MRRILPAIAVTVLLSVSACGSGEPAPAAAPATTIVTSPSPTPTTEAQAANVCRLVSDVQAGDTDALMKDGVVLSIADAARGTGNAELQAGVDKVFDKYRMAVLSKGTEDALITKTELITAGIELHTICIKARLD